VIKRVLPQLNGVGGGREQMDKFMESRWFMRIVGLTLALLLYTSVTFDETNLQKNASDNPPEDVNTIQNVPLEAFYDSKNLVISGLPESVDITMTGPKSIVQKERYSQNFTVFVDLNDLSIGKHRVKVKVNNISEKIDVKVNPEYVNVSIQERVSDEFTVEPEFNEAILADGFEAEGVSVDPRTVKITGAKDVIDQIAFVKATLDIDNVINENITRKAKVQVLDRELNKLDVVIEPDVVDVTVSVVNPSKEVPVVIQQKGKLPDELELESITVEPKLATIFGRDSVLEEIKEVAAELDLSKVKEDKTLELPIKVNDGLNKVTPEVVEVKVNVKKLKDEPEDKPVEEPEEKPVEQTISEVPVELQGTDEEFEYSIIEPDEGLIEILLNGYKEDLDPITRDDFTLVANLSGLPPGEHELDIEATGPEEVDWELSRKTLKVEIKEKTSA
jgi:YbbR domain-containing protein